MRNRFFGRRTMWATAAVISAAALLAVGDTAGSGDGTARAAEGPHKWYVQDSGLSFTTEEFLDVSFTADQTHGHAVGTNGAIFATADGGRTWIQQHACETSVPCTKRSPDRIAVTLTGVSFSDARHGIAVGDKGVILATADGGQTWIRRYACDVSAPCTASSTDKIKGFLGVSFVDAHYGWVVGEGGVILSTTDGGATWRKQQSGTTSSLRDVSFVSAQRGWAAGGDSTIMATTDGGATWTAQLVPYPADLEGVSFSDASHGHVVGRDGTGGVSGIILGTIDGGRTWIRQGQTDYAPLSLSDVDFADARSGFAVGAAGTIYATTDGGRTWVLQPGDALCRCTGYNAVSSSVPGKAHVVGIKGTIIATTDGGRTWVPQNARPPELHDVSFTGGPGCPPPRPVCNGHAVGDNGTVLVTTDGGETWVQQNSGVGVHLRGVAFVDDRRGWFVGQGGGATPPNPVLPLNGVIRATTDGGATWREQTNPTPIHSSLYAVSFVDDRNGHIVGSDDRLRTTDGGATWTSQRGGGEDIFFVDRNRGYVAGFGAGIEVTTDGGRTWSSQQSGVSTSLLAIYFADAMRGYAVGRGGTIIATTDGGERWIEQKKADGSKWMQRDLHDVACADSKTCYVVGAYGTVLATTDGGATWTPQAEGLTTDHLNAVTFSEEFPSLGWAVGKEGTIIATLNLIDPGPVTELTAAALDGRRVRMGWRAPPDDGEDVVVPAAAYEIYAATAPFTDADLASEKVKDVCAGTCFDAPPDAVGAPLSYTVTGLVPETAYHFGVRAVDDTGNAGPLVITGPVTLAGEPPGAVTDLAAVALSGREVKLTFSAPGSNGADPPPASRFLIKQSTSPLDEQGFGGAQSLCGGECTFGPKDVGDRLELFVKDLEPDTTYHYALKAIDDKGETGPLSNAAETTTLTVTPGAVTDLAARAVSHTAIELSFSAPGSDGTNPPPARDFVIKQSSSPIADDSAFDAAVPLCGGVCTFAPAAVGDRITLTVTDLEPATTYHYAVRARYGSSIGPRSSGASMTTQPDGVRPGRIDDLRASGATRRSVRLEFSAPGDDEDAGPPVARYVVKQFGRPIISRDRLRKARRLCEGSCDFDPGSVGDVLSLTVEDLRRSRAYHYAVVAIDRAGNRSWLSNPARARPGGRGVPAWVSLEAAGRGLSGVVEAEHSACVGDRTVVVRRLLRKRRDAVVGRARSDDSGLYTVARVPRGRLYAVVRPARVAEEDARVRCMWARSAMVRMRSE